MIEDLMTLTDELRGVKCQQNSVTAKFFQNKLSLYQWTLMLVNCMNNSGPFSLKWNLH